MKDPRVLIIGAGISGLSTAWWLARQGIAVEIWEAEKQPGGKIRSQRENGFLTEDGAALLVNFRTEVDRLISETGLQESRLRRNENLKRYLFHEDHLQHVPLFLPALLASSLWSGRGKLRLMAEPLIPKGGQEGESVSDFITRRLGREVLDTTLDAFVSGTLASDPDQAEARSVLPRLTALEERYGSLTAGMFINKILKRRRANKADTFSFRDGMSSLVQAMADTPGIRIRYETSVSSIDPSGDGWKLTGSGPGGTITQTAAQVILSTPADQAGRLLRPLQPEAAALLEGIEHAPVAVLHLGMRKGSITHPLDGTGFLAGKNSGLPLNGNLWMSRIFPNRAPGDSILLTSYLGGARDPEKLQQTDEQLVDSTLGCLQPILGIRSTPEYVRIKRHFRGLPLYHGHYRARLAQIGVHMRSLPGLHLNGNYMDGVSVRERIFQGMRLSRIIISRLPQDKASAAESGRLQTV
jgi:oxygen-dependent protoporphyrinogen oxidase